MEQKDSLLFLINEIGKTSLIMLILAGFLFGIAFTYTHFWAIKHIILKSAHFKKIIFALTFFRLFIFAAALAFVAHPNHGAVRIILFFIGFMIGRIGLMFVAKKEIQNDSIRPK